jgi:hypothetical protein
VRVWKTLDEKRNGRSIITRTPLLLLQRPPRWKVTAYEPTKATNS